MPWLARQIYLFRHKLRNNVAMIVREGDVFSAALHNAIAEDLKEQGWI